MRDVRVDRHARSTSLTSPTSRAMPHGTPWKMGIWRQTPRSRSKQHPQKILTSFRNEKSEQSVLHPTFAHRISYQLSFSYPLYTGIFGHVEDQPYRPDDTEKLKLRRGWMSCVRSWVSDVQRYLPRSRSFVYSLVVLQPGKHETADAQNCSGSHWRSSGPPTPFARP